MTTDGMEVLFANEQPDLSLRRFRLHPSYFELSLSASYGCQICKLFATVLFENAKAEGAVVDLVTSSLPQHSRTIYN